MAAARSKKVKKKRGPVRKLLRYLFLALLVSAIGFFAYIWFSPTSDRDVWDFVAEDAVFVIEADDPITNWEDFSDTKVWKHLKKNDLFADIEEDVNFLDTLIKDNRKLFNLISDKKLLISAHMTRADDYDFVYLVDLQQGAKVTFFMTIFKPIISAAGFPMKNHDFGNGQSGYTISDGSDLLYMAFVENVLVSSYSKKLLVDAVASGKKPSFSRNGEFKQVRDGAYSDESRSSIGKVHLNFDRLDEYMNVFMDEVTGTVIDLSKSLGYASLDIKMDDEYAELSGRISADTAHPSLATVLLDQNRSEIMAAKILPPETSFMLTIDYHDFDYFYESITELMGENEGYKEFEKTKDKFGNLLGVNKSDRKKDRAERKGKDKDYWDWLGQEIALATLPINASKSNQAYLALIHTPDFENATHDLEEIAKKIRRRTPVRFSDYKYKGKQIRYLAMKGFFRLFMGKLFKKFDKPKYVILDNFVVFSNDTIAIHRVIDAEIQEDALYGEENYRRITKEFDDRSNIFVYINNEQLYPFLPSMVDDETARDIRKNKPYITCFPQIGLQLTSDDGLFDTKLYLEFEKP